jgi:hypothetical protein
MQTLVGRIYRTVHPLYPTLTIMHLLFLAPTTMPHLSLTHTI